MQDIAQSEEAEGQPAPVSQELQRWLTGVGGPQGLTRQQARSWLAWTDGQRRGDVGIRRRLRRQ